MSGFTRWVGKIAVITGASGGIGGNLTEKLVKEGIIVVGLARNIEPIEDKAKTLSNEKGKLFAIKCDLTIEQDILNAFKWISENLGPVHILVNNAAVILDTNLIDGDTQKWRKMFDLNVFGGLICTREAVKVMRKNCVDGHIVNINSIYGHYDLYSPLLSVHGAAKHAVTNLTETLRKEFNANGLKIKITSVSPGLVDTDMSSKEYRSGKPILNPEDITEAIVYALSTKPHVQVHEIMVRPVGEE